MKNMHECNKTNDLHAECNKRLELIENQINFLQEECNFKTKLINSLLENLFNHENHPAKSNNGNTFTPTYNNSVLVSGIIPRSDKLIMQK